MPKARKTKRKTPVTVAGPSTVGPSSQAGGTSSHPQATRTVIRRFHVLIKRRSQLQNVVSAHARNASSAQIELGTVEREIEELGGLEAYQHMSSIGQSSDRGGGSEKILIGWLRELQVPQTMKEKSCQLRLLEVGALKPDNYSSCGGWISVSPIDLHSRHPSIQEQDFLLHQGKPPSLTRDNYMLDPDNPYNRSRPS
ncbi:putative methyltransferase-domain-containing protein [Lenzites betulinus]|nr:putative methyltransferase-domain-containing protein [Lenzites betulinus]